MTGGEIGETPGEGWRGRRWTLAAACAAAAAVTLSIHLWAATDAPVGVFYDDGIYVVLAKSLAQGEGYRYLNLPGAPPAVHYPPGYPFVLSLLLRWGPEFPAVVPWMKGLNALLSAAAAGLVALYSARRLRLPSGLAAGLAAATFACVPLLAVSTVLFSEPLFFALAAAALWVADRPALTTGAATAAGLLAGAAFLTRSVGLAVAVGVVWAAFARGGRARGFAAAGVAAALVLPWLVWVGVHGSGVDPLLRANYGSYFAEYAGAVAAAPAATVLEVLRRNLVESLGLLGTLIAPGLPLFLQTAVVMALLWAAGRAAWRRRAETTALGGTLALYVGGTLLWPFEPYRYLVFAFPWLVALAADATRDAVRAIPHVVRPARAALYLRVALALAIAFLALGYVRFQAIGYRARGWERPQTLAAEALVPIADWVARETAPGDVVATDGEPLVYLYTGRRAVPNTVRRSFGSGAGTPEALARLIREMGARYLAVSVAAGPASDLVERLAAARPDLLRLVHITPIGGRIFRVETAMLAGPGAGAGAGAEGATWTCS